MGNACVRQDHLVDAVAVDWTLVLGLQNDARDVQMLRILQRLIDPRLQYLRAHLHLLALALEAGALRLHLFFLLRGRAFVGPRSAKVQVGLNRTVRRLAVLLVGAAARAKKIQISAPQ